MINPENTMVKESSSDANSISFTLELTPLASFELSSATVAGCKNARGVVELFSPAPAGGVVLNVSDTLASATPPATVTIPEGATKKSFSIKTVPVAASESGTVTVNLGAASLSQPLTVRPMGLASLKVSPTTVVGGQDATGTATLECAAGPGPVTVDLSTSNATVAKPVSTTVVVPQGLKSETFTVSTDPVLSKTYAMITGKASTTTKTRKVNVVPAASVSPTSIKFGSVAVGATSATQTVTLSNKGAVPYSVSGVSITGTNASWFVLQSNTCPANLPAGDSCTIVLQFKPLSAANKTAKLSVATSATSTPLSVSLSGTGI